MDIAVTQGIACLVEIISLTELSLDHNPVATELAIVQDARKVVDWAHYGRPFVADFDWTFGPHETVRKIDEAVVSEVDVSSRMKLGITPESQHIPEDVFLLDR